MLVSDHRACALRTVPQLSRKGLFTCRFTIKFPLTLFYNVEECVVNRI